MQLKNKKKKPHKIAEGNFGRMEEWRNRRIEEKGINNNKICEANFTFELPII